MTKRTGEKGPINWTLAEDGELIVTLPRCILPQRNINGYDGDIVLRGSKDQYLDNEHATIIIEWLNFKLEDKRHPHAP